MEMPGVKIGRISGNLPGTVTANPHGEFAPTTRHAMSLCSPQPPHEGVRASHRGAGVGKRDGSPPHPVTGRHAGAEKRSRALTRTEPRLPLVGCGATGRGLRRPQLQRAEEDTLRGVCLRVGARSGAERGRSGAEGGGVRRRGQRRCPLGGGDGDAVAFLARLIARCGRSPAPAPHGPAARSGFLRRSPGAGRGAGADAGKIAARDADNGLRSKNARINTQRH